MIIQSSNKTQIGDKIYQLILLLNNTSYTRLQKFKLLLIIILPNACC